MITESARLVDTRAAAYAAGVSPATVRKWIQRGHLTRHGHDHRRRTLVAVDELTAYVTRQTTV